jgi:Arylsulfotransferase (ASST)
MGSLETSHQVNRRQLLIGLAGAGGVALGGGAYGAARLLRSAAASVADAGAVPAQAPVVGFASRPDLRPPSVLTTGRTGGYLLLGPGSAGGSQGGPLIVDADGEPIWFRPLPSPTWASNFSVSRYKGQPVLGWWEGEVQTPLGYGRGEGVIVDRSYRELARVRAVGGHTMDVHEFQVTPEGTALFTCYPRIVAADLSGLGGPQRGRVLESIFQEVDIRTGRLLLEWRSLDHIPLSESYRSLDHPYDYLHLNSIDVTPDGQLLVSARHTFALYKLDRATGEVIWRLGGKRSDFALGPGARFSWQHDARQLDERTVTLFDNGSDGPVKTAPDSRVIVLGLDDVALTVRLQQAYHFSPGLLSSAMGSAQRLPGGGMLVGWGTQPYVSEFTADGVTVAGATMPAGQQSYRTFRQPWTGEPREPPALAATRDPLSGRRMLYVSWNGATEVTHWQVSAGRVPSQLSVLKVIERAGFETATPLGRRHRYAAATALDRSGRALATSATIKV